MIQQLYNLIESFAKIPTAGIPFRPFLCSWQVDHLLRTTSSCHQ
jgi:hypothetical protein